MGRTLSHTKQTGRRKGREIGTVVGYTHDFAFLILVFC